MRAARPVGRLQSPGVTCCHVIAGQRLQRVHLVGEAAHMRAQPASSLGRQRVREHAVVALGGEQALRGLFGRRVEVTQLAGRDERRKHPGVDDRWLGGRALDLAEQPVEEGRGRVATDLGRGPRGERTGSQIGCRDTARGHGGGEVGCAQPSQDLALAVRLEPRRTKGDHRRVAQVVTLRPQTVRSRRVAPDGLHELLPVGPEHVRQGAARSLDQIVNGCGGYAGSREQRCSGLVGRLRRGITDGHVPPGLLTSR